MQPEHTAYVGPLAPSWSDYSVRQCPGGWVASRPGWMVQDPEREEVFRQANDDLNARDTAYHFFQSAAPNN